MKNFGAVFGSQFLVYNVHSLTHLADDADTYGYLNSVSCFPFENHLQELKKMVRRPKATHHVDTSTHHADYQAVVGTAEYILAWYRFQ